MRRGFILLIVLGLLGILAGVAVAIVRTADTSLQLSQETGVQTRARMIARSGLEKAIVRILNNPEDPDLDYGGSDFDRNGMRYAGAAGVLISEDLNGNAALDNEEDQDGDGAWADAGWLDANGESRAFERWDGILQTEDVSGYFDSQWVFDAARVTQTSYGHSTFGVSGPNGISNNRNDVSASGNYRFYYSGWHNRNVLYNTYNTPVNGSTFSNHVYSQIYERISSESKIDLNDGGFMDEDENADGELLIEDVNRNGVLDELINSDPGNGVMETAQLHRVPLENSIAPSFAVNHDYGTPLSFSNGNTLQATVPGAVFPKLQYGDGGYFGISGVLGGTFEDEGDTFSLKVVATGNRVNVNMGDHGGRPTVLPITGDDVYINPWPVNQGLAVFLNNLAMMVADDTFNPLTPHNTNDWDTLTQNWFIQDWSLFGMKLLKARPASGFRNNVELAKTIDNMIRFPPELEAKLIGTIHEGLTPWKMMEPYITARGGYIIQAAIPDHQLNHRGYPFVSGDRITTNTRKARQHVFPANWVRSLQDMHNGPLKLGDRQIIDINTAPKPLLQAMLRGRSFRFLNPDTRTMGMAMPDATAMRKSYFKTDTAGLLVTSIDIRQDPRNFWFTGSGFPLDDGSFMPERWVPTLGMMEKFPDLTIYSSTEKQWNTMCDIVVDAMVRKRRSHPFASFQEFEDFLWALARHRFVSNGDGTFTAMKHPKTWLNQYKIAGILAAFDPNTRFMKFNPDKVDRHPVESADQIVDPLFSIGLRRTTSLSSSLWLGNTGLEIKGYGVFHRLKFGNQYIPSEPVQSQHMSGLIPLSGGFSDQAGDYEITSLGRIRRQGNIVARRKLYSTVDLFDVIRFDSQADFVSIYGDTSVLGPHVEPKSARLRDVTSYPENIYRAHYTEDASTLDGSIQLAKIRHGGDLSTGALDIAGTTGKAAGSSGIWSILDAQTRMAIHFQDYGTRADRRGGTGSVPVGSPDDLADMVDEYSTWAEKKAYLQQHDPLNWKHVMNPSPLHASVPSQLQMPVLGSMSIPNNGSYLPQITYEDLTRQEMTNGLPLVSPAVLGARPLDVSDPTVGHYDHGFKTALITGLDHRLGSQPFIC